MRYAMFRNIAVLIGLSIVVSLGWCTCRSCGKTTQDSNPLPAPVPTKTVVVVNQPMAPAAPVYAPSAPVATSPPDVETLHTAATSWLANNPRSFREMRRQTTIAGVRVTALRFPAADARKFTDNEADWSQLRFDMNGDGRDDEKWLIKFGRISKRELLGPDGKTVGDPILF